jgi:hypothetical protein
MNPPSLHSSHSRALSPGAIFRIVVLDRGSAHQYRNELISYGCQPSNRLSSSKSCLSRSCAAKTPRLAADSPDRWKMNWRMWSWLVTGRISDGK